MAMKWINAGLVLLFAAFVSVFLQGCSSGDAKDDLIKLMDTATGDYDKVDQAPSDSNTKEKITDNCQKVKTAFDEGVKQWVNKNKDEEHTEKVEDVQKDGKGKESYDKMVAAETKCFTAGGEVGAEALKKAAVAQAAKTEMQTIPEAGKTPPKTTTPTTTARQEHWYQKAGYGSDKFLDNIRLHPLMGHEHDAEMAKYGTPEQREQRLADLRKEMETKEGRTAYQNEVARELTAIEVALIKGIFVSGVTMFEKVRSKLGCDMIEAARQKETRAHTHVGIRLQAVGNVAFDAVPELRNAATNYFIGLHQCLKDYADIPSGVDSDYEKEVFVAGTVVVGMYHMMLTGMSEATSLTACYEWDQKRHDEYLKHKALRRKLDEVGSSPQEQELLTHTRDMINRMHDKFIAAWRACNKIHINHIAHDPELRDAALRMFEKNEQSRIDAVDEAVEASVRVADGEQLDNEAVTLGMSKEAQSVYNRFLHIGNHFTKPHHGQQTVDLFNSIMDELVGAYAAATTKATAAEKDPNAEKDRCTINKAKLEDLVTSNMKQYDWAFNAEDVPLSEVPKAGDKPTLQEIQTHIGEDKEILELQTKAGLPLAGTPEQSLTSLEPAAIATTNVRVKANHWKAIKAKFSEKFTALHAAQSDYFDACQHCQIVKGFTKDQIDAAGVAISLDKGQVEKVWPTIMAFDLLEEKVLMSDEDQTLRDHAKEDCLAAKNDLTAGKEALQKLIEKLVAPDEPSVHASPTGMYGIQLDPEEKRAAWGEEEKIDQVQFTKYCEDTLERATKIMGTIDARVKFCEEHNVVVPPPSVTEINTATTSDLLQKVTAPSTILKMEQTGAQPITPPVSAPETHQRVTSGLQSASSAAAASVPEIATRLQIDHTGQIHDVITPTFASNAPTFDDPILPGPPQDAVTKSALQLNAAGFQQAAASRNDIGSHLGDTLIPGPPHETPNDIVTHAAVTKSTLQMNDNGFHHDEVPHSELLSLKDQHAKPTRRSRDQTSISLSDETGFEDGQHVRLTPEERPHPEGREDPAVLMHLFR